MTANLLESIEKNLPEQLTIALSQAISLAEDRGLDLYLVGGLVRDTLLARTSFDLDLVVEGDAISLARGLARISGARLTVHQRFQTAKLKLDKLAIDITQARSETYARPGALPTVQPGKLRDDLSRRDFAINAMAVRLTPSPRGELLDPYGGRSDLAHKLVRILHNNSFVDDATRIWRAVRYEQRLGFQIEEHTLKLLKQGVYYLDAISGDRIRHELEAVFLEKEPERILHRAWTLKVLTRIHPSLRGDAWLAEKYRLAREYAPAHRLHELYPTLLTYRLDKRELEDYIKYLRPARHVAMVLRDIQRLKENSGELARKDVMPSRIDALLRDYNIVSILANVVATGSRHARANMMLYLNELRDVHSILNGDDLRRMGVPPGPKMQDLLTRLRKARLDGNLRTKAEEEVIVKRWVQKRF